MNQRPQLFGKTLFTDFLMSNLAVLLGIMMLSNVSEQRKQERERQEAALRTDGEYAILMEWSNASPDDVDLYVRDPAGTIAFFSARDVGLMHLEHDDQGTASDRLKSESGEVRVERNEERIILRGTIPGEYVVNVHMYSKRDSAPTTVTVRLFRLKGADSEVVMKERTLKANGNEATAFRFTVRPDGSPTDVNELQRRLVGGAPRTPQPQYPEGGP